jgi:hypothetical protein
METWNTLNELSGIGKVGATVIMASLVTCILACAFVIYDTIRDTYYTIKELRKNGKSKN